MDPLLSTVVGAGIALAGVLTTSIITLLREKRQREWSREDLRREHKLSILEKRLVQTEKYLEAMTADMKSVMGGSEVYLRINDPNEALQRFEQRAASTQSSDTTIFAQGPAINAIGDAKLNTLWEPLIDAVEHMGDLYTEIYVRKFIDAELIDTALYDSRLNETWLGYTGNLGKFYKRLDDIRRDSFDEYA